jgi:hypothetical protein
VVGFDAQALPRVQASKTLLQLLQNLFVHDPGDARCSARPGKDGMALDCRSSAPRRSRLRFAAPSPPFG